MRRTYIYGYSIEDYSSTGGYNRGKNRVNARKNREVCGFRIGIIKMTNPALARNNKHSACNLCMLAAWQNKQNNEKAYLRLVL